MTQQNIVRAWKDEDYRASLSAEELAAFPMNPAGLTELSDADLEQAIGGAMNRSITGTSRDEWCVCECP